MKHFRGTIGLLMLTTLGCSVAGGPSPTSPAAPEQAGTPYRVLAVAPVLAVDADSQLSTNPVGNATDGNTSSSWSNGGYRNPTAWLRLRFGVDRYANAFLQTYSKLGA